jgi:predicted AlkP superfamily phosphohydrolase/phosphomutase
MSALVLGLDVGDGCLVRHWAKNGRLPHLERLIGEGAWATLATPAETLHVSAWPSLYTGTAPGAHGVYYTFQPCPGEQGAVRFRADQYGQPTVWERAARAGRRCLVFDAPYTNPVDGGGFQVLEWGTWAHYTEPASRPTELLGELMATCGRYPLGFEANQIGLSALDPAELVPKLTASAAAKGRALAWLLGQGPFDLAFAVFGETHPSAHYLWPAGRVSSDVARSQAEFERLREVYAAVDRAIGAVLESSPAFDHVLVVSGDGAGANHAGWHLLPEVLARAGFLVPPGSPEQGNGAGRAGRSAYTRLRELVPASLRQSVSRRLPAAVRDRLMKQGEQARIDWSRTRAYCLPTDLEGCLRINLRGREPEGIVEPADFERTCDELEALLRGLSNPATGRRAVAEVVRVARDLPGARAERLPDLVARWDASVPIAALSSPAVGTVSAPSPDMRPGTHAAPGFLIARGPGFGPGNELSARVEDLAPTLLARLGLEVPAALHGRVLGT